MTAGNSTGIDCPRCGIGHCMVKRSAHANDHQIMIRERFCDNPDCGFRGNTFETWFTGSSIKDLDEELRFASRMNYRIARMRRGLTPKPRRARMREDFHRFGAIHYVILSNRTNGRTIIDTARRRFPNIATRALDALFRSPANRHDTEEAA